MNNDKYYAMTLSVLCMGFFSTLHGGASTPELQNTLKRNSSGLEVRANVLGSSGRFVQDFIETDANGNSKREYSDTSDLTTKGYSLIVGYARDYVRRDQYSFFYIGYENQKWNDAYDSVYHAGLIGVEGGIGGRTVKLIYGGEFAFGTLDTGIDGLGYLYTFTAEPFIGFRVLPAKGLSINFRVGARGYFIEEVTLENVTSENAAFTANAQIGIGYSFY